MTIRAVDCQGFAGGFTLGMVQAGFELVGKKEMKGGFGVPNCEANRHLLGHAWEADVTSYDQWYTVPAEVVFGNPPCSGFSLMSSREFRGVDSPVNACMWAFGNFVARTRPLIAIFESVQQAFTGGLELMRALRAKLEEDTGEQWSLFHILHNNASVGGCSIRKRYFWCVSRIPFGIEPPSPERVPNVFETIGDLEGLADTWLPQPYRRPPSWWSEPRRNSHGVVDGHWTIKSVPNRRCIELMHLIGWEGREFMAQVAKKYYERHGTLPDSWAPHVLPKMLTNGWHMGFHQPIRWVHDHIPTVLTGAALCHVIHPSEPRFITHREAARIQGFPDDWLIEPLRTQSNLPATWGKGIPVDVGRWVGGWIKRAIEGNPGEYLGEEHGEREWKMNFTNAYRDAHVSSLVSVS